MSLKGAAKRIDSLSIKWKWSFTITLTILFVYAVFAILVYYSTQQVLLRKEETEVAVAMGETSNGLELLFNDLTEASVQEQIDSNYVSTEYFTPLNRHIRNTMVNDMPEFSKLSLRVFNSDGEEVYSIGKSNYRFQPIEELTIRPIQGEDDFVLSGIEPIYSRLSGDHIGYIQVVNSLDSFHTIIDHIIQSIYIIGVLILLLTLFLAQVVSERLFNPIRQLKNAMSEIIKEPDSDTRLKVKGADELAELAKIYNKMIDRMQINIDSQKQFVEDVSHELRTPVAIVEGHLKLLDRWGKDDPEILEESISASVQEITRMKSLVQEMLDLSRAAQVDIHYRHERTDAVELVQQIHNNIQLVHPDFNFILDIDVDNDAVVNMYRNHLEQVLIILLDNAVKYSKDRKEVHLSLASTGSQVQIAVQDYGEGISNEDLDKIFDRFYRIDKARSRQSGGNGLGLSIAKQLITGYGGKITVNSVVGNGSIFNIRLPLLQEETTALDEAPSKEKKPSKKKTKD